ncbi:hypothetical protein [Streptomyces sp. Mg1]|uniref:hypothetical protein n=2 Tax=Streptomyces sp. Mg1 TaxID=465541 RepID=UPI000569A8CE|nr:hypothetical protein [Streptomyces sp. Mg1]AKL68303.1 hypothetical protein M444_25970 [Streptomyces sp. Mg1]
MTTALAVVDTVSGVNWMKRTRAADTDHDRGLSAGAFAALMLGAFLIVATCALVGGWVGLIGIVVTAVVLIGFSVTRM